MSSRKRYSEIDSKQTIYQARYLRLSGFHAWLRFTGGLIYDQKEAVFA